MIAFAGERIACGKGIAGLFIVILTARFFARREDFSIAAV
jgi:hypothetical protein